MLYGARTTLRAIEREDLARLLAFNNDVEIELAGGGDPPWPQSSARLAADLERQFSSGGRDGDSGGVRFAIEADGQMIGVCGLHGFDATHRACELGITIGERAYWGKGYGREVVKLLLDYAFRLLNANRVYLRVHARNERAIRAYKACGFIEEGRLRQHVWSDGSYDDLIYMGVLRQEWTPEA